ncbi:transcriptional regulator, TetR family [Prauserella aidingensis]|uniref:TetR/AcrR family transcriptional regulator n=1 Tax=Prauserella aidingensis TaxID=387890 RepID=UPI0020A2D283|nr:TetR/AcrR family transcriptional regulator [Prauserella aidingensis]MCP2252324.1 transcriptional regulator, TetR family [Prauserella aidingensis]
MAETTETGLPRAVAIAWGMQEVPQRGPNRGLSHERIVAAAIEIADAQGLSAVTMQAVATSLGFTTMSLYRYVSGKDELLRLMQDAAIAVPEKVSLPGDWREALRVWAGLVRDAFRGHPWVLGIPRGQVSVLMPNSVRVADLGLAALRDLPLDDEEKIGVILTVSQYVTSTVELELSLADEGTVAVTQEGLDLLGQVVTPDRYPHLAPVLMAGNYLETQPVAPGADEGIDTEYEFGLELIISGLEQRVRGEPARGAGDIA